MVVNAECNGEQFCGFEVMIMESIALSWYERLPDVHEEPDPDKLGLTLVQSFALSKPVL